MRIPLIRTLNEIEVDERIERAKRARNMTHEQVEEINREIERSNNMMYWIISISLIVTILKLTIGMVN